MEVFGVVFSQAVLVINGSIILCWNQHAFAVYNELGYIDFSRSFSFGPVWGPGCDFRWVVLHAFFVSTGRLLPLWVLSIGTSFPVPLPFSNFMLYEFCF